MFAPLVLYRFHEFPLPWVSAYLTKWVIMHKMRGGRKVGKPYLFKLVRIHSDVVHDIILQVI